MGLFISNVHFCGLRHRLGKNLFNYHVVALAKGGLCMLKSLSFYLETAKKRGFDLNKKVKCWVFNSVTQSYVREVFSYEDYIRTCYDLAVQVPLEELKAKQSKALLEGKEALRKLYNQVRAIAGNMMKKRPDLDYGVGNTPIDDMSNLLMDLMCDISEAVGRIEMQQS